MPQRLAVSGEAVEVAAQSVPSSITAFSRLRTMVSWVYRSAVGEDYELKWLDGRGAPSIVAEPGGYKNMELLWDGRRVAVSRTNPRIGRMDVWLLDESGTRARG